MSTGSKSASKENREGTKTATASIIVPTRNMEATIESLLESIFSQEYDGDFDVLIMDSSDDRTPEIAGTYPVKIVRVEPEDYNYGKTRNEGAAMSEGEFLVFISADVEIADRRWLSKLTRHFADPKVAGVYGRQIPQKGASPMEQFYVLYTYRAESSVLSFENGKPKLGMVFFSDVNGAIRRSVWQQIKKPEMLKSDDIEWTKRALLAGYRIVYDAEASVYHSNKYSLKTVFHEYFDSGAAMPAVYTRDTINYSMWSFVWDGLKYIANEYKFMLSNGYWYWIPYAAAYDIVKFLGVFLGSKQKHMPLWMKRALCKKKNHWDKYDDVIKEPA
jgi:rhamnosyltransferase